MRISTLDRKIVHGLENVCMPILVLGIRLWIARIFWYSGLTKISHWSSTKFLFSYEYKVPLLAPDFAAFIFTSFEIICPVLLTIGLFTRLATLPLLLMIAVIQFTYLNIIDHSYWCIMLGVILCYGPGRISVDRYFKNKLLF